jgi:hypothetical protein
VLRHVPAEALPLTGSLARTGRTPGDFPRQ